MAIRLTDEQRECVDCGEAFTFSAGEQAFYERRALTPPKRCAGCRFDAKVQREMSRTAGR
jgi:hypothetical protein